MGGLVKINSLLFCDDVRVEANGKQILLGVYDLGAHFTKGTVFPIKMPLAFYCRFLLEKGEEDLAAVKVAILLNKKEIASSQGEIKVMDTAKPVSIYQGYPLVVMPEQGDITFQITLKMQSGSTVTKNIENCMEVKVVDNAVPKLV